LIKPKTLFMKRIVYIMLTLSSILMVQSTKVNAQKLYAGIGLGYGFPMASANLATKFDGGLTSQTNELVKGSYGKGAEFALYGGYMIHSNLGAELGFSYLAGAKWSGSYIKETVMSDQTTYSARMMRLSPGVRVTFGEHSIKPYMRLGLVIGLGGKITADETIQDMQSNTTTLKTTRYTGGISMGLRSSIGAMFKLSDLISLFGEINVVSQSLGATSSNVTAYSVNGADKLSTLTTSQKQTAYSSSYSSTYSSGPSISDPAQALKSYRPFSSLGLEIGVHFTL
jgi:hypothetical protein